MAYKVTYGDLSFKAAFFDVQHQHSGDTWGMPGTVDTQVTIRVWVLSSDSSNLDNNTRIALFEHSNWFRGDEKNEAQVLTLDVDLGKSGSHKYTVENAWIKSYSEYQETTYGPDRVEVIVPRVDPGETPTAKGDVIKGEVSAHNRLELLFVGYIDADQGSRIE
jgi:hypothetical protein